VAQYRLQAWDLNTNTLLTDLTATGVSYGKRIDEAGEFGMTLSLTDPMAKDSSRVVLALGGVPFKVLITANENQTILYSGIAWRVTRSQKGGALVVTGKALPSYFTQITSTGTYTTDIAPTDLLANVVRDVQTRPGANVGLQTRQQIASPPAPMKPAYTAGQRITVGQIVADLTAAVTPGSGGVDYYVEDAFNAAGVPQHTMVISAPRAGQDKGVSQKTASLDAADDWTWPVDASTSGNHIFVVGGGSGSVQPTAEASSPFPIGGLGQMPLMEQVLQYSQISNQNQLQSIANGAVQMFGRPVTTPTITLPANNKVLPLGSFTEGDDILITASVSNDFPVGLSEWWRVVAYTVDIADEGVSTFTLMLNRPPVF
jgi:hypothetical protein